MENKFTISSTFTAAFSSHPQRPERITEQLSPDSLALHDTAPTQPPGRAIELRTATSVTATSEQRCEHCINADLEPLSFQALLDELLDIPTDEYIQLAPDIMPILEDSYKKCLKKYSNDPEAITTIKIKHLLNRAIYYWQINHDREKTSKQ